MQSIRTLGYRPHLEQNMLIGYLIMFIAISPFAGKAKFPLGTALVPLLMSLAACGGGSGGSGSGDGATAPEKAPALSLEYGAPKTLHFKWADVGNETEYRLLENPDGLSGFTPIASIPADSVEYGHSVFLPAISSASYILQACNSQGCADSSATAVDTSLAQAIGYFKASNTDTDDYFGQAVAISDDGQTLAIGAPGEDSGSTGVDGDQTNNSQPNSGAVYVFTRSTNGWQQQAYIKSPTLIDSFGKSLALSDNGTTLAVGAPSEDGDGTSAQDYSGAVHLYVRDTDSWQHQSYLKASTIDKQDGFGEKVALDHSGDTLVVSTYREDSNATGINNDETDNSATESGAVYVFSRVSGAWNQQAYMKASNTDAEDRFGRSLALSADGKMLAVGATKEDSSGTGTGGDATDNSTTDSGAVYLFSETGGDWTQTAFIKASNTGAEDHFGRSLAVSADGTTLAVGALLEKSGATGIGGDQADNSSAYSGAAYLFTQSNGLWQQQAYIKPSNTDANDYFGSSLVLSNDGNTLAVTATGEDSQANGLNGDQTDNSIDYAGAVYTFTRSAQTWRQQAYLKPPVTEADDAFAASLALSGNGQVLVVGAFRESSGAKGIGGDQTDNSSDASGAVLLY